MLLGILLALLTSGCWALGNLCIQRSGRAVGAPRALLWALGTGGTLAGLCALRFDHPTAPVTSGTLVWLAVGGVSGVLAYVTLFYALARARLTIAVPLVASWSLWATLLSVLVLGETTRPGHFVGGAIIFLGVVLVSVGATRDPGGDGQPGGGPIGRRALLAAFGSALSFAIMVPSMAEVAPAVGAFGASALVYGIGIAIVWPIAWLRGVDLRLPPRGVWLMLLLTGLVETAGFVLLTIARRYAPTAVVSPIASLSSALTLVVGWLVLREKPSKVAALGAVLASVGLVILAL